MLVQVFSVTTLFLPYQPRSYLRTCCHQYRQGSPRESIESMRVVFIATVADYAAPMRPRYHKHDADAVGPSPMKEPVAVMTGR